MGITAADVMCTAVMTAAPRDKLVDVERSFISERVSGVPVVDDGRLVGVVSRSDIVRQLCVEQSLSEEVSDYFRQYQGFVDETTEAFEAIADRVGRRIEHLCVRDMMIRRLVTVGPNDPLAHVARQLTEHHIHRVLVVEDECLLGIISSLDIVRLVGDEKLVEAK
jgi:CBS domain-containing protein